MPLIFSVAATCHAHHDSVSEEVIRRLPFFAPTRGALSGAHLSMSPMTYGWNKDNYKLPNRTSENMKLSQLTTNAVHFCLESEKSTRSMSLLFSVWRSKT